ncbi:ankyrin repeat-containing domain protein [Achaetomium macrosporum]|uniref:Ankyrin repeat-containing domain protein n=1 Tax=Achaetomium macrosporum TaxID=79813 RepID=A0AAN7CEY9_9PEZI|nr:ankyrin repeat-containing domain protein [Achaetomium macrosporum]
MFVVPTTPLERRRTQNRIAQRRFREKQNRRKAAAGHQTEGGPGPDLPAQNYANRGSTTGPDSPEDQWWSAKPVVPISENIDAFAPTGHTSSTASPSCESSPIPNFFVSKGALLSSQGLLMGEIDFLSFDHALELPDDPINGPSNTTSGAPLLTPTSHRSASPVEPGHEIPEVSRDRQTGAAGSSMQTHAVPPDRGRESRGSSAGSQRTITAITEQPREAEDGLGGDHDRDETPWLGPLHMATVKGHDRIVRILLGHTADANERDGHGRTPMMHAVAGGFDDVLQTLLGHGARVADTDREGRSALHWAVAHRRESLLLRLLDHCRAQGLALLDRPDGSGKTPLHLAIDMGFEAGVLLLLEYGADPSSRAPCNG